MDFRFYKDPDSGLAHCYTKHDVREREVLEVLVRPAQRFRRRDGTLVAEGQTAAGRYLRVIFREYADRGYTFVITAYPLSNRAMRAYRRRRKRR